MRYLVCRLDGIKTERHRKPINSEYWPMVVDIPSFDAENMSMDAIVRRALDLIKPGYVGMHDYLLVPLNQDAVVVSYKHKPAYEVSHWAYLSTEV